MSEQYDVQPSQGEQVEEQAGFAAAAREQAMGEPGAGADAQPAEPTAPQPPDESSSPA